MRVKPITIDGTEYPLCYSLAVVRQLSEAYGSVGAFVRRLTGGDFTQCVPAMDTALAAMLHAGRVYCRLRGEDAPPALQGRPSDLMEVSEFKAAALVVLEVISDCSALKVDAVSPNAKATVKATSPTGCGCKRRGDGADSARQTSLACRMARLWMRCKCT